MLKGFRKIVVLTLMFCMLFSANVYAADVSDSQLQDVSVNENSRTIRRRTETFTINNIQCGYTWEGPVYTTLTGTIEMDYDYGEGSWSYIYGMSVYNLEIGVGRAVLDRAPLSVDGSAYDFVVAVYDSTDSCVAMLTVRARLDEWGTLDVFVTSIEN